MIGALGPRVHDNLHSAISLSDNGFQNFVALTLSQLVDLTGDSDSYSVNAFADHPVDLIAQIFKNDSALRVERR